MSLVLCATIDCGHQVREGLRRRGRHGIDGQELADGVFCWRCRARHARALSRKPKSKRTRSVR